MRPSRSHTILFLGTLLLWGSGVFAQSTGQAAGPLAGQAGKTGPSDIFLDFLDSNYAQIYSGVYHTLFTEGSGSLATGAGIKHGPRLQANSSAYLGAALSYKWLTIAYSFNLPNTSLLPAYHKEVKSRELNVSHWWSHWGLDGSYEYDRGLVAQNPDVTGTGLVNSVWQFVNYSYVGVSVDYFLNPTHFSYKAADNFSRQQIRSGGTLLLMMTPAYQNFALQKSARDTAVKDTVLFNLLQANAKHIILLAKAGYTYQFVWDDGRWSCSPWACIGPGLGYYADDLHTRQKAYPMLGYQGKLTFGYNGPKWYTYVSGIYDLMEEPQKNLGLKTVNENASLSVGYRFRSSRHHILKFL